MGFFLLLSRNESRSDSIGKRFVLVQIQQRLRDKRPAVFIHLRQNIPEYWLA
jgi:hypothetical protein